MDVFEAIDSRISCRQFHPDAIDEQVLVELLERASRAPSGSNLQPWHAYVVSGDALVTLKQTVAVEIEGHDPRHAPAAYLFHPPDLGEPYVERKLEHGAQLYGALGIKRDDAEGRLGQYKRNFELFGAPTAIFLTLDRDLEKGQWADVGGFLATILYLVRGYGLDACPQQSWCRVHETVAELLSIPDNQILYCGIAVGRGDRSHPANSFRSERASAKEFARFYRDTADLSVELTPQRIGEL